MNRKVTFANDVDIWLIQDGQDERFSRIGTWIQDSIREKSMDKFGAADLDKDMDTDTYTDGMEEDSEDEDNEKDNLINGGSDDNDEDMEFAYQNYVNDEAYENTLTNAESTFSLKAYKMKKRAAKNKTHNQNTSNYTAENAARNNSLNNLDHGVTYPSSMDHDGGDTSSMYSNSSDYISDSDITNDEESLDIYFQDSDSSEYEEDSETESEEEYGGYNSNDDNEEEINGKRTLKESSLSTNALNFDVSSNNNRILNTEYESDSDNDMNSAVLDALISDTEEEEIYKDNVNK